jgi:hypothetical protein
LSSCALQGIRDEERVGGEFLKSGILFIEERAGGIGLYDGILLNMASSS